MRRLLVGLCVCSLLCAGLVALSISTGRAAEGYACLRGYGNLNAGIAYAYVINTHTGQAAYDEQRYAPLYSDQYYFYPSVRYSPDGQRALHWWRAHGQMPPHLQLSAQLKGASQTLLTDFSLISGGDFSPDSQHFAVIYQVKTSDGVPNYLLLGDSDGRNVQHISLEGKYVNESPEPAIAQFGAWSADGQYFWLHFGGREDVYLWDVQRQQLSARLPHDSYSFFGWSPLGHFYAAQENDAVVVRSAAGDLVAALPSPRPAGIWKAHWSPDGQAVALVEYERGLSGIITLDGRIYTMQTAQMHYFGAWSADSKRLAIFTERSDFPTTKAYNWQTLDLVSGDYAPIRERVGIFFVDPAYQPPSTVLLFTVQSSTNRQQAYLANADGSAVQAFTEITNVFDTQWRWSADRRYLYRGSTAVSEAFIFADLETWDIVSLQPQLPIAASEWDAQRQRLVFLQREDAHTYRLSAFEAATKRVVALAHFSTDQVITGGVYPKLFDESVAVVVSRTEMLIWSPDFTRLAHWELFPNQHATLRIMDASGNLLRGVRLPPIEFDGLLWTRCA
jgi:Tol biopolymer transport system component